MKIDLLFAGPSAFNSGRQPSPWHAPGIVAQTLGQYHGKANA